MAPNAVGMAPRDADTDATATLQRAAMSERGVRIKRTPSFKERAFADSEKASGGGRGPRPPASPEQKSRRDGFRQKSKATPLALLSHAVEAPPVVEPQRTERSVGGGTARQTGGGAATERTSRTARFTERQVEKAKLKLAMFENDLNVQEKRLMLDFKRAKKVADKEKLDVDNMKLKAKMIRYYRTPSSPPTSSYERELARKRLTSKSPIKAFIEAYGPRVYS